MKILLVANTSWNLKNFREDLIKNFKQQGHAIHVISSRDESTKTLVKWGCKFTEVNFRGRSVNPIGEFFVFLKLFFCLLSKRPDVILSFTIKPNIYCGLANIFLSRHLIVNITGMGIAIIKESLVTKLVKLLYKIGFKKVSYCFFQNNDDKEFFVKSHLIEQKKIKLIPGSGINLSKFPLVNYSRQRTDSMKFNFLFVGRILKEKGIFDFLKAATMMERERFAHFNVIGHLDKNKLTKEEIELFYSLIQSNVVTYKPFMNNIQDVLLHTDCMVLPSYREGTSKAIMEALASGIPVIASNVPGCNNLVEDNVNGFLCEPKNEVDLKKKMILMYNLSKKRRTIMGLHGRQKMKKQFDVKFVISAYNERIDKLFDFKKRR